MDRVTYVVIKEIIDRLLASLLLIGLIIIPVLPLTVLAIWIEDPGQVFFLQDRIGQNGRKFKVIKFRSMYKDADEKIKKDIEEGRTDKLDFKSNSILMVTKVGKIIRKLSIDELPQLVNIIKGDMAVIGPRPLQDFEVTTYVDFTSENKEQMKQRLSVKPGLLCYWQVTPNKNDMSFSERMKLDVQYSEQISFQTDCFLLLRGIKTVIGGNNI